MAAEHISSASARQLPPAGQAGEPAPTAPAAAPAAAAAAAAARQPLAGNTAWQRIKELLVWPSEGAADEEGEEEQEKRGEGGAQQPRASEAVQLEGHESRGSLGLDGIMASAYGPLRGIGFQDSAWDLSPLCSLGSPPCAADGARPAGPTPKQPAAASATGGPSSSCSSEQTGAIVVHEVLVVPQPPQWTVHVGFQGPSEGEGGDKEDLQELLSAGERQGAGRGRAACQYGCGTWSRANAFASSSCSGARGAPFKKWRALF